MSATAESVTTIDLLRHGACQGGEIYRGRTDVPLSDEGWQQMEKALQTSTYRWQRIVTSPLLRCRTFAEHCAAQFNLPVSIEPSMMEMDFGDWEGRLLQDVWREEPELVSGFYDDPGAVTPPGGEPAVNAQRRIALGWDGLMEQYIGERFLLVCHGGVIRLLLSHLLELPLSSIARLHVPYASMSTVQVHRRESSDFAILQSLNAGAGL